MEANKRVAKKILVVDDDPQIVKLISNFLHRLRPNDRIITALTCTEALIRLKSDHFDMVISDYNLPDGNGQIVLCNSTPPAYRVGISGMQHQKEFAACCDRFLSKPFDLAEIQSLFNETL